MATLDTTALEADNARLIRQMHALNISIGAERARGNVEGVRALLATYTTLLNQFKANSRLLGQQDFGAFDRFILSTGNYVEQAVTALPGAISAVPKAIGDGLIRAALPFAAMYALYLYFRGK